MKAVLINQYGTENELTLEEIPVPEIGPNEVLIKVHATSVNPIDWKIRKGIITGLKWEFPIILGWDVSGVIEKVGSGVMGLKPGDEVYAFPQLSRNGTYAEYVAIQADAVAEKPHTLDHLSAASIPLAGLTAWQALFDHGKLLTGQKLLIIGAAGGVGTLAIQLAKNQGAHVTGTASEKNIDFLKALGADNIIDYTSENFWEKMSDIDLVLDCMGGDAQMQALLVLKPGGILVSIVGINSAVDFKSKDIEPVFFMTKSSSVQLMQLGRLIEAWKLKPVIAEVKSLNEIKNAHRLSEEGHTRGKIVISIPQ
jgi:NADPH:quinone reductase-like Zn-dependent oxidoreductase